MRARFSATNSSASNPAVEATNCASASYAMTSNGLSRYPKRSQARKPARGDGTCRPRVCRQHGPHPIGDKGKEFLEICWGHRACIDTAMGAPDEQLILDRDGSSGSFSIST